MSFAITRRISFFVILLILAFQSKSLSQTTKSNLSLTMERTGCLGRCPICKLIIKSDGTVVFDGIKNTKLQGKVESSLSKEKVKQIIGEINSAKFFKLKDSYDKNSKNCPVAVTDHSTVMISIDLNGKKKTITHYLGCYEHSDNGDPFILGKVFPQPLYDLENKIDEIVETKRWIGERK